MDDNNIIWFSDQGSSEIKHLGGKNASLGEMTRNMRAQGIPVPDGFAVTARAYWEFVDANELRQPIGAELQAIKERKLSLAAGAKRIPQMIARAKFPPAMAEAIRTAYRRLSKGAQQEDLDVAVRSSATAEDLPDASFAGRKPFSTSAVRRICSMRSADALRPCSPTCPSRATFTDRAHGRPAANSGAAV